MTPRVIGIDLSLVSTGIAGPDWVDRIASRGTRADTLVQRRDRLRAISRQVAEYAHGADLVVIEQPAYSRTGGHAHDRSGLWWSVVSWLMANGIPVAEVAPTTRAKYATGNGRAGKDQVMAAAIRRYPSVPILGNDEADAYVLCAMGLEHLGHPPAPIPQTHRAALAGVAWPEGITP